jgi:hypothetical protein
MPTDYLILRGKVTFYEFYEYGFFLNLSDVLLNATLSKSKNPELASGFHI